MNQERRHTWLLTITPIAVAAGLVARPYVSSFIDNDVVAAAITGQPQRWLLATLLMVLGAVLLVFALPAAVHRAGGTERRGRWVRLATTIGVVGYSLQLGLDGLGGVAAHRSGADVAAYLEASAGGAVIGLALLALLVAWGGLVRAVLASERTQPTRWMVVAGAALGALGHLYPASPGEYLAATGTATAFWILAAADPVRTSAVDETGRLGSAAEAALRAP